MPIQRSGPGRSDSLPVVDHALQADASQPSPGPAGQQRRRSVDSTLHELPTRVGTRGPAQEPIREVPRGGGPSRPADVTAPDALGALRRGSVPTLPSVATRRKASLPFSGSLVASPLTTPFASPAGSRRPSLAPGLSESRRKLISLALAEDRADSAGNPRTRPLTAIEQTVALTYLLPDHVRAIGEAARIMNVAVSFREAGAETLKRLKEGAIPKPAMIKDKSIKPSSLNQAYGKDGAQRLHQARALDIDGLVGRWHYPDEEEGGHLTGLYVFDPHSENAETKFSVVDVDDQNLEEGVRAFRERLASGQSGVCGDGDMGDLVNKSGNRGPVPHGIEDSYIEAFNFAIGEIDPLRPFADRDRWVVQHGPQHNFHAHLSLANPGGADPGLTRALLPVAMCDGGVWRIIRTEAELETFYASSGARLKGSWASPASTPTTTPTVSRQGSVPGLLPDSNFTFGTAGRGGSRRGTGEAPPATPANTQPAGGSLWNTVDPFGTGAGPNTAAKSQDADIPPEQQP